ncbi:MAG TPA: type II secretion system secretin GspD [Myxococcaceae bacterium]|nr:type II secretion system secretin GspD [Myxococcaceae bacterium]
MTALLPCLALSLLAQAGTPLPQPGAPGRPMRRPYPGPTTTPVAPPAQPTPTQTATPPPPGPVQATGRPATPPSMPPAGEGTTAATTPNCSEVRKKARFNVYFDKVDIEKLVQTVSDATCRTFILGDNVRGKISIIGPDNGKVDVSADEFYAAFLAALDANQLAVVPQGRFSKIVEKAKAKQNSIPFVGPDEPYTTNEQMLTRMFKIRYADLEPLRGVVQQLVSQNGDTIPFQPDTLIVNDIGSNMHRLERIIEQLDSRSSSDEMRVIQVRYANAQELATTIQKLFDAKANRPGARPGLSVTPAPAPAAPPQPGAPPGAPASGGPATVTTLLADERTNKLVVVATPAANERIDALLKEIDVPISGEGRINVYALQNANAEDIAATLQSLAQGTANRARPGGGGAPPPNLPGAPPPRPQGPGGVTAAELFQGEVKISPDKATNSLVVVASQSDYRNLVRVIEKLDLARRQVFVEAVIMEVNLDRNTNFGISLHQGFTVSTSQGQAVGIAGTKYTSGGVPPSFSLTNLTQYGGFLAGLQGPTIPAFEKLGLSIPSFGIVLHALQQSSDVNVLSTPHLLTSDNEEAEITVGQNVPFQAGFSPQLPTSSGATVPTGSLATTGSLLGGIGAYYAPINRQNVELKLNIKPQINASDYIRMVINESTEEIASQDPQLGPTTSKRTAKTTVVAKDQETVVIGGIMQERTIESISKVPVFGDIPLLGYLFRETTRRKVKVNLLLFLTPYIIRDASDFRRIFEKKMAERQRFVEEFYGQVPGYDVPIDFGRKQGPLAKMNQLVMREEMKVENGGPGLPGEQVFRPGTLGPAAAPAPGPAPTSPADIGRQLLQSGQPPPATTPAPAPVGPLGPPGTVTPGPGQAPQGGTTAPAPAPPPPAQTTPPPADERLKVQPGGQAR